MSSGLIVAALLAMKTMLYVLLLMPLVLFSCLPPCPSCRGGFLYTFLPITPTISWGVSFFLICIKYFYILVLVTSSCIQFLCILHISKSAEYVTMYMQFGFYALILNSPHSHQKTELFIIDGIPFRLVTPHFVEVS